MEDIEKLCEDLRKASYKYGSCIYGWHYFDEAANAIEELKAENERIRSSCYPRDGVEAIIRERDRFKAERDAAQAMLDGQPLCNAGDMVYTLLLDEECYYPHTHGWYIYPERVGAIGADGFYTGRPEDGVYYRFAQIGKRVFLTRDEAEAALEERCRGMSEYIEREAAEKAVRTAAALDGGRTRIWAKAENAVHFVPAAGEWIPADMALPGLDEPVLVIASGKPHKNITLINAYELAEYTEDGFVLEVWPEWTNAIVTHWMPLPEPPKEEPER